MPLIGVADAFDAMVSERTYATKRSHADALTELHRCAGTQFDPSVVAAFQRVISRRQQPALQRP